MTPAVRSPRRPGPPLYWQLTLERRERAMEDGLVDSAEANGLQQINRGRYLMSGCSGGTVRELRPDPLDWESATLGSLPLIYTPSDFYDAGTALVFAAGVEGIVLPALLSVAEMRTADGSGTSAKGRTTLGRHVLRLLADEAVSWPAIARPANRHAVELHPTAIGHASDDYFDVMTALYSAARHDGVDLADLSYVALRAYNDCVCLARCCAARREGRAATKPSGNPSAMPRRYGATQTRLVPDGPCDDTEEGTTT